MRTRFVSYCVALLAAVTFTACSGDGYVDAIPKKVSVVAEIDMPRMAAALHGDAPTLLSQWIGWKDAEACGVDLDAPVYLFETTDGTFGLCMKMDDDDDLEAYVADRLCAVEKKATKPVDWRKCRFALYDERWLMGWTDDALLMAGPIVAGQQQAMQQQMATWLRQKEKQSVKTTTLYERLQQRSDDAVARISLQAFALPDNIAAMFTLGLTKKDNPRQVEIGIDIVPQQGRLMLYGDVGSPKASVQENLTKARQALRPIDKAQIDNMAGNASAHLFFNMQGKTFLPYLRSNPMLQSVMTIANAAIDLDNVIRSIDGTCHIQLAGTDTTHTSLMLTAPLAHTQWLADVDYWKQSAPQGTTLTEQTTPEERAKGQRHFVITSAGSEETQGQQRLNFGLYDTNRLYLGTGKPADSGGTAAKATGRMAEAVNTFGQTRSAIVVDLKALADGEGSAVAHFVKKNLASVMKIFHTLIYIEK